MVRICSDYVPQTGPDIFFSAIVTALFASIQTFGKIGILTWVGLVSIVSALLIVVYVFLSDLEEISACKFVHPTIFAQNCRYSDRPPSCCSNRWRVYSRLCGSRISNLRECYEYDIPIPPEQFCKLIKRSPTGAVSTIFVSYGGASAFIPVIAEMRNPKVRHPSLSFPEVKYSIFTPGLGLQEVFIARNDVCHQRVPESFNGSLCVCGSIRS